MTIEDKIDELVSAVTEVVEALQPKENSYGYTMGDELMEIKYNIGRLADTHEKHMERIADALEKIASK